MQHSDFFQGQKIVKLVTMGLFSKDRNGRIHEGTAKGNCIQQLFKFKRGGNETVKRLHNRGTSGSFALVEKVKIKT